MRWRLSRSVPYWLSGAVAAWMLLAWPGITPHAQAQDRDALKALQERLDQLEKQNRTLHQRLNEIEHPIVAGMPEDAGKKGGAPSKSEVKSIVDEILKEKDKKAKETESEKKKQAEAEGYEVGKELKMFGRWDHGMWLETSDKSFRIHAGGRTQMDVIGYNAPENVQFGNNGVGRVDDALNFRRARLEIDGTFWEVFDFWCEYDFMNTDTLERNLNLTRNAAGVATNVAPVFRIVNTPVPTDLWIQFRNPIMNIRIGNLKPAISFEHNTSSRFLNFLERSYAFDIFIGGPDNGFTPGILAYRNFLNDRVHLSASVTKWDQTIFGTNSGDGEWQACVRAGCFPIWKNDGQVALWVGCGARHNDSDFLVTSNRQFTKQTDGQVRLRARTELRNGTAETHTPLLDIFPVCSSQDLINPEFAFVCGPWSFAGEYFGSWLHDARAVATNKRGVDMFTQAAYVEALYFLTGEYRQFNRQIVGFQRVIPHENVWLVKEDGTYSWGLGAWQVGARWSWADLANANVLGGNNMSGNVQALTLGLNWFLNPNSKIQFNYTLEHRYGVNQVAPNSPAAGLYPNLPSDGYLRGFGVRLAFDW